MQTDTTRILLIGQNDTLVNNVRKIIPRNFAIDHCLPLMEEVYERKDEYEPDIAILCLDVDVEMDVESYAEMSSLGLFDDMAVIVLGQVEECRVFENKVFIRGVHMMQRPVKGSTLALMLKTCERELDGREEERPAKKKPLRESEDEPIRRRRESRQDSGGAFESDYSDYRRDGGGAYDEPYEGEYRRERGERYPDEDYDRPEERRGSAEEHREPPQDSRYTVVVSSRKKKSDKRGSTPKLHHDDVLLIPPEGNRYFRNIVKEKQIRREIVRFDDSEEDEDEFAPKVPTHVSGKFSILVVDDDVQLLGAVRKYLQNDYFVTTVPSGRLAYRFLEVDVVDVILLDYLLRDENGPAVFKTIRSNPKTANIPVIFLTGVSDKERVMNVLSMNPQGYLLKPIEKQELLDAIAKVLE